jgi:hypothetical protein
MTRSQQRRLLRTFVNQVRDHLLAQSDRWPEDWDGHELRELAAQAFDWERTPIMRHGLRADRRRLRACSNEIITRQLY